MPHCRKVDSNNLLSNISGIFLAHAFHHMVWFGTFATEPETVVPTHLSSGVRTIAFFKALKGVLLLVAG